MESTESNLNESNNHGRGESIRKDGLASVERHKPRPLLSRREFIMESTEKNQPQRKAFLVESEKLAALGLIASPCPSQSVDYVVEKLRTSTFGAAYIATYQRKILELVKNDLPTPFGDKDAEYIYGTIVKFFDGCTENFRNACIQQYLKNVLPAMEAEQKSEEARQEALDDLLDSLDDKSTDEVIALTKKIKRDDD